MSKPTNEFDAIKRQLTEGAVDLIDHLAPNITGGKTAVGQVRINRPTALYEFLLFETPGVLLAPDQLDERARLWETKYRDMDPTERKQWALWGRKEAVRLYGPPSQAPGIEGLALPTTELPNIQIEEEM